jgi:hypothetical protein
MSPDRPTRATTAAPLLTLAQPIRRRWHLRSHSILRPWYFVNVFPSLQKPRGGTSLTDESHDRWRTMLGPYALGALDEDERQLLDAHLVQCRHCREQLTELEAAARSLSTDESEDAPSDVWETIRKRVRRREAPPSEPSA